MHAADYLLQIIVILAAAVVLVSLFQRFRLGAILGYLVAGLLIGPSGLALVDDLDSVRTLAEFGVVFLLFTVGLELPLHRFRALGHANFALGGLQVLVTGFFFGLVALHFGASVRGAVAVGGGLALSSTAIVLRLLSDRGALTTRIGRAAFAVLLVQDLAVGPLLALVSALGEPQAPLAESLLIALAKMIVAMVAILGVGRFVISHVFRAVAASRDLEVFAALTILVVLGSGFITEMAGLSMAFGAFLAGMLLAETQYRHQVAADILPFRALLLGLFFITVGMSIDLAIAADYWMAVVVGVPALLLVKGSILVVSARLFGVPASDSLNLGFLLSQSGEFAFVLLGAALAGGVLPGDVGQYLIVVVSLTMLVTPFLAQIGARIARGSERRRLPAMEESARPVDIPEGHFVIAGFGRVGQTVGNRLKKNGTPFIAIDSNPERVTQLRKSGVPIYFGDATRAEVLLAAEVERARAVVVAIDSPKAALQCVAMLHYVLPELKIYARAHDEAHGTSLRRAGADVVVPELVATGTQLGDMISDEP